MRVLLVADRPGWAWAFKAEALKASLPQYHIKVIYNREFLQDEARWVKEFDAIHCFGCWETRQASSVSFGVSSHNFETVHREKARKHYPTYQALTAVSRRIYLRLIEMNLNDSVYLCQNGVDEELFTPLDRPEKNKLLIIGWQGKSDSKLDSYGWGTLFEPLKEAIDQEPGMKLEHIDRNYKNALPRKSMVDFFQKCDVFIHTGLMAGTPNPVFEAAACGKTVICTRIGVTEEMIVDGINGYIIDLNPENRVYENREKICPQPTAVVQEFMKKLRILRDDRELCVSMGNEARKTIEKDWTWKKRAKAYIPLFENHRTIKDLG